MSKWICTIFEGIAGFVIWSFLGCWLGTVLLAARVPGNLILAIVVALGLVMAVVYARRAFDAYEGRRKPELTAFGNIYSAMLFVICAVGWGCLIYFMQAVQGHH